MQSLSETDWDLVISGTGLPQSLLALALSRSGKNILHVDRNGYYGGAEAALSLQDAEEWVESVNADVTSAFRNAQISNPVDASAADSSQFQPKLGFARSYSLALAPQIIYTRSNLLPTLVSSKVYRQLEFLAVGSWWIYERVDGEPSNSKTTKGQLRKIPGGREDIFADKSIDLKSKRSLIKFLRLVADPSTQAQAVEQHGGSFFEEYLTTQHGLSTSLQAALHALTLSPDSPSRTKTAYALRRITRHLTSFGVFGQGFNSVVSKWGGVAEIAQVSCRAGAVGGAVYMLGKGIERVRTSEDSAEVARNYVALQSGDNVSARHIASGPHDLPGSSPREDDVYATRSISVMSSPLASLFSPLSDGGPTPAGSVAVFPTGIFTDVPIYLMIHSSDTGECPVGQSVIYASANIDRTSGFEVLQKAVDHFITSVDGEEDTKVLWRMQYDQKFSAPTDEQEKSAARSGRAIVFPQSSTDLAFDDSILKDVKDAWEQIGGVVDGFMRFEDRESGAYEDE